MDSELLEIMLGLLIAAVVILGVVYLTHICGRCGRHRVLMGIHSYDHAVHRGICCTGPLCRVCVRELDEAGRLHHHKPREGRNGDGA